ncbi:MAG: endolytic transglycosylase MltG [Candidatus Cloacimonetes bacterium]|nr:endolytic transglycosylase MltG [Candidatus Cloacimonadota bacterium]
MRIFAVVLAIVILIVIGYELYLLVFPTTIKEVVVEIKIGEPAAIIADKLVNHGVIRSKWLFIAYIRLRGVEKDLSYGNYLFSGRLSTASVARKLIDGRIILEQVTIPEGLNIRETARRLEASGFGKAENYIELSYDPEFAEMLTGFSVQSLEGFLYPETYHFGDGVSEEYVLRRMVNEFFNKTATLRLPDEFNYSFYELIILASIIEKEARFHDEKPLIASVFLNRLSIGKRLQADPTVAYALSKNGIQRTTIYYVDLQIDSPYNTYRRAGLPPTPICNPSVLSMQAVLDPADSEFLYFFAGKRGRHIFSKTYTEHLNKQRALRNRPREGT